MKNTAYIVNRKWSIAEAIGFSIYYSLFTLFAVPAHAAFEDIGTGARGTALGTNYVSMGDDALSLAYNPAALARVQQKEITSEYSRLYAGLTDGSNLGQYYLGYGQPISWGGTVAFGWKQFSLDSLYTERTLSLGYGEWINSYVAIGGAVKQLHHSFGVPNMVVDNSGNVQSGTPNFFAQYGNASTAYAGDLGVLYRMTDRHTIGISIQNINEPNVALNPADHEIVPRTVQMSLAYDAQRQLTLAAGLMTQQSLSNQTDYTWTGSAEKWWKLSGEDQVALRGSLATGSREFQQAALGSSYRFSDFQIDYAFVFNMTGMTPGSTLGTHRFSFTYHFGEAAKKVQLEMKPAAPATLDRAAIRREIEELITAKMMQGTLPKEPPAPAVSISTPMVVKIQATQVSTPAVSPADFAVPIPARSARPFGSRAVKVGSREELLARVSSLLQSPSPDRVSAFESQFDLWHGYFQSSGIDLVELMSAEDTLEDTARYYAHISWLNAPERERLNYLVRSMEKYLEPILRHRAWNLQDARDLRYKAWLQLAWSYQRSLPARGMKLNDQIVSLQRIVTKALIFERQPPEPVSSAPRVMPHPTPTTKAAIKVPAQPLPQKTNEHPVNAQIRYEKSLLQYSRRVAAGAPLSERIKLLKKILANCQQAGLDCRLAYQEFEATFDEELQGTK